LLYFPFVRSEFAITCTTFVSSTDANRSRHRGWSKREYYFDQIVRDFVIDAHSDKFVIDAHSDKK
jgi:hypothetical protein